MWLTSLVDPVARHPRLRSFKVDERFHPVTRLDLSRFPVPFEKFPCFIPANKGLGRRSVHGPCPIKLLIQRLATSLILVSPLRFVWHFDEAHFPERQGAC